MQRYWTALAHAVELGYANIAKSLLQNGATMDFEDEVRRTDMIIAECISVRHWIADSGPGIGS